MSNQDFSKKHGENKRSTITVPLKNKRVFIPSKAKNNAALDQDNSIASMFAKDKDLNGNVAVTTAKNAQQQGRAVAYRCETVKGLASNSQANEDQTIFEETFVDSEIPANDTGRAAFNKMISALQENDMVHVQSLYYLADDIDELNSRIKLVLKCGASLYFVEEKLYFVSLDDVFTKQWMCITEVVDTFNAKTRSMKHVKGIANSLMKGGRTGRKQALSGSRLEAFRTDAVILGKSELMAKYEISSQSVWRYKNMTEEAAAKLIESGKVEESNSTTDGANKRKLA